MDQTGLCRVGPLSIQLTVGPFLQCIPLQCLDTVSYLSRETNSVPVFGHKVPFPGLLALGFLARFNKEKRFSDIQPFEFDSFNDKRISRHEEVSAYFTAIIAKAAVMGRTRLLGPRMGAETETVGHNEYDRQ